MVESKTTILVVDDEENIRLLLQRILEGAGYAVIMATNGQEALDKVSLGNIDLILLDIKMPGLDGYQTLSLIRKNSDVSVVMVSGVGGTTPVDEALSLGVDDYVSKPFNTSVLLARVDAKLKNIKKRD